jgi:hypothetical protein
MHSGLGGHSKPVYGSQARWRSTDVTPATDSRSAVEAGTVGTSMT